MNWQVKHVLGVASIVIPLKVILVGWPGEEKPARTRHQDERGHWE
jgi:hypothetical protein